MATTKIFTAYEKLDMAEPTERVELVREGFSYAALVFNVLWLVYEKLWFAAMCYVGLLGVVVVWAQHFGLNPVATGCLQLLLQLLLAVHAYDLVRYKLARRGYRMAGVIVAESALAAEQRYYNHIA
ncbi:MAG: DUF2628 domain-containing protein [Rickettsiales bacterium]